MTGGEKIERRTLYAGYSTIERVSLRGADGEAVVREVESHGCSAAVLPYDPVRRVAALVRQIRLPVLIGAGARELLEPPAGMIDGAERGEETARREAFEETGLSLKRLDRVAVAWCSPGVSTERMNLYLSAYSETDRMGSGGGLAKENETVSPLELGLSALWSLVEGGDDVDMKLIVLTQALRLRRPELFVDLPFGGAP
jgi:nudix-type nucleoside diphosphatase (YffH/AdpP family)